MRAATSTLDAILNYEMELHVKYCAGWGLKEQEMERANEAKANMAYTRYVLERGLAGLILQLNLKVIPIKTG
jgi:thiaminase/transcriptional activator TenA